MCGSCAVHEVRGGVLGCFMSGVVVFHVIHRVFDVIHGAVHECSCRCHAKS